MEDKRIETTSSYHIDQPSLCPYRKKNKVNILVITWCYLEKKHTTNLKLGPLFLELESAFWLSTPLSIVKLYLLSEAPLDFFFEVIPFPLEFFLPGSPFGAKFTFYQIHDKRKKNQEVYR